MTRVSTNDQRLIKTLPAAVGPTEMITSSHTYFVDYFVDIGNRIVKAILLIMEEIAEKPEDCETYAFLSRQARMASLLAMAMRYPETKQNQRRLSPRTWQAFEQTWKTKPGIKQITDMELNLDWLVIDLFLARTMTGTLLPSDGTPKQYDIIMPKRYGCRPPDYWKTAIGDSTSYRMCSEGYPQQLLLQDMRQLAQNYKHEQESAKRSTILAEDILQEVTMPELGTWTYTEPHTGDSFEVEQTERSILLGPRQAFVQLITDGWAGTDKNIHERLYKDKRSNPSSIKTVKIATVYTENEPIKQEIVALKLI